MPVSGHSLQDKRTLLNRRINCDIIGRVIVDLVPRDFVEYTVLYDDARRMSKKHEGLQTGGNDGL